MAKINEVLSRTIGGRLLMQFKDELFECIEVPNRSLPAHLRDNRTSGRTLASINAKLDKREQPSEAASEKAERLRRVALYTAQIEAGAEEITYEPEVLFTKKAKKKIAKLTT